MGLFYCKMNTFNSIEVEQTFKARVFQKVILTSEEWTDFYNCFQIKQFKKGDFLTREGQIERYFYFVADGVMRYFFLKEGKEVDIGFSYQYTFAGVYDSFLMQQPSRYYLQAIEDSVLLGIDFKDLNVLFDKYKNMERWGRLINQEALIGKAYREIAILSYSAEERYRRLLQQSPHCLQLIPQKYLASYLAMTPETFSRLRKRVKI